jgi:hypothetical protein
MSDNKTNENTSTPVCKDGVCYLAQPEIQEPSTEEVVHQTDEVPNNSPTNPNGPTDQNSEQPPMNFGNLFAHTLQNLHQVLAQGAAADVSLNEDNEDTEDSDDTDSEDDVDDDWEKEDVEDTQVCVHLNDKRWKAFQDLLESHKSLCRAFEKLLNERADETDGEETDTDESE